MSPKHSHAIPTLQAVPEQGCTLGHGDCDWLHLAPGPGGARGEQGPKKDAYQGALQGVSTTAGEQGRARSKMDQYDMLELRTTGCV